MKYQIITIATLVFLPSCIYAASAPVNLRINNMQTDVELNADTTFTMQISADSTYLTQLGLNERKYAVQDYDPQTQSLKVLEAYVLLPNGQKISITDANIFTRPSPQTDIAPQYTRLQRVSVVFPQIVKGSETYIRWELKQKTPSRFGFNLAIYPNIAYQIEKEQIRIHAPSALKINWIHRGFAVTTANDSTGNTLTATLQNVQPITPEPNMVSSTYFSNMFAVTTLPSWQSYGNIWWSLIKDKIQVTKNIQALAQQISQGKSQTDAIRDLYNYVVQKINLLDVSIYDLAIDEIPTAEQVLANGYGDSRGKTILYLALLKAIGIDALPAITSSSENNHYPIPVISAMNAMLVYFPSTYTYADMSSTYLSFGQLDTASQDKLSVLVGQESQTNITPADSYKLNQYIDHTDATLTPSGAFIGNDTLKFLGNLNANIRGFFDFNGANIQQAFNQQLNQTDIGGKGEISYTNPLDLNTNMVIHGKWVSPAAVTMSDTAIFMLPEGYDDMPFNDFRSFILTPSANYPFLVGAKTLTWTYQLTLPPGYKIKSIPTNTSIKNAVGEYVSQYQQQNNTLSGKRQLVFYHNRYEAKDYPAFKSIVQELLLDSRNVVVLKKEK